MIATIKNPVPWKARLASVLCAFGVLLSGARGAASQQFQRQTMSETGSVVSGPGQNLESNIGQTASLVVADGVSNALDSGYVNTDHAPGTVTTLVAMSSGSDNVQLQWTEVGADGFVGQAATLTVKFSTNPITTQSLYDAASTYAVLTPLAPGGFESHIYGALLNTATYYFAVEARDLAKNQGQLSNPASANSFGAPPAAITTLDAVDGSGGGTSVLTFLSPGASGNTGNLNPGQFRIDYSTVPGASFNFVNYQLLVATNTYPGVVQTVPLAGLLGNATYYFDVFTGNSVPLFSAPSNVASVLTLAYAPVAAAASNVSSAAVTLNWTSTNNVVGTHYVAELSTSPTISPLLAVSTAAASFSATFSGLSPNTTYYGQVEAVNAAGIATAFTYLGPVVLSNALNYPLGLAVASGNQSLTLTWNPVLSGSPLQTNIYSSLSPSGPFVLVATVPVATTSFLNTGLTNGVTYYYELTESNGSGASPYSPATSGVPASTLYPQGLPGLSGTFSGTGFVLNWAPNPYNVNGAPLNDLKSYAVFRASTVIGAVPVELAIVSSATFVYTDLSAYTVAPAWYFVRAIDTSGNQSVDSIWVHSSPANEHYSVSPDHEAYAQIPNSETGILVQQGIVLRWTPQPQEVVGRVAAAYTLTAINSATGQSVPNYELPQGTDFNFHYSARDPQTGGPATSDYYSPLDLAVFISNGSQFIKIGGAVDSAQDMISAPSQQTGPYEVRASVNSSSFAILQTVPTKIFTPNGDGIDDTFTVFFDNPNNSPISQAKVYDISGAAVADMVLGGTGNSLMWDGRDHRGGIAHAGIYIYQIKTEGKTFNGTVVVAR